MANLKAELPGDLYWLNDEVEALVRPGAFLMTKEPLVPNDLLIG